MRRQQHCPCCKRSHLFDDIWILGCNERPRGRFPDVTAVFKRADVSYVRSIRIKRPAVPRPLTSAIAGPRCVVFTVYLCVRNTFPT